MLHASPRRWSATVPPRKSPRHTWRRRSPSHGRSAPPVIRRTSGPWARFFGIVADARGYGALFYLILSLLTGTLYFTLVAVMLLTGIGLLPVGAGVIILLLFFAIIRALSLAEGRIMGVSLGVRMPRRPRGTLPEGHVFDRVKHWLTDRHTWTSILYMALQLPLGIVCFTIMVAALSLSAAGVALPDRAVAHELPAATSWSWPRCGEGRRRARRGPARPQTPLWPSPRSGRFERQTTKAPAGDRGLRVAHVRMRATCRATRPQGHGSQRRSATPQRPPLPDRCRTR